VRTNFYQRPERPVIAIKVESGRVEGMPSPKPLCEIYVHARKLEGIHLRGGKVARGGIRWSDRHDDFRIEILGLMKTQMVKNAIIVPVGAKGGFVLKGELPPRPALGPRGSCGFIRAAGRDRQHRRRQVVHRPTWCCDDDVLPVVRGKELPLSVSSNTVSSTTASGSACLRGKASARSKVASPHGRLGYRHRQNSNRRRERPPRSASETWRG
jgi:hypothetical protein